MNDTSKKTKTSLDSNAAKPRSPRSLRVRTRLRAGCGWGDSCGGGGAGGDTKWD